MDNPLSVQLIVLVVQEKDPGVAVATYCVISAPPVFEGAAHVRVTFVLPGVAVRPVGRCGTLRTVAVAASEKDELPATLLAETLTL